MKTFTKPLALSLALSAALAAPAWADTAAFTVLTLDQAPTADAIPALAAQLKSLQVDAVSVRQVQRGIGLSLIPIAFSILRRRRRDRRR